MTSALTRSYLKDFSVHVSSGVLILGTGLKLQKNRGGNYPPDP